MTNQDGKSAEELRKLQLENEQVEIANAKARLENEKLQDEIIAARDAAARAPSSLAIAQNRQAVEEANSAADKARRGAFSDLIPDLSSANASSLTVGQGEPPMAGGYLAFKALEDAALNVDKAVRQKINDGNVLITSDEELVVQSSDCFLVAEGINHANKAAERILAAGGPISDAAPEDLALIKNQLFATKAENGDRMLPDLIGVSANALAAIVPQLLAMFSSKRTLNSGSIATLDLTAAAAVAGALVATYDGDDKQTAPQPKVFHDDFRLLLESKVIISSWQTLLSNRVQLSVLEVKLKTAKAGYEKEITEINVTLAGLRKQLAEESNPNKKKEIEQEIDEKQSRHNGVSEVIKNQAAILDELTTLTTEITSFAEAITSIPEGSRRSMLMTAMVQGQLHQMEDNQPSFFSHVLLVKSQPGSWSQVLDDRPLWLADRFASMAEAHITYMLIDTVDSSVVAAGTETAVWQLYGTLGNELKLKSPKRIS
ncbi:MAG: hypothetical protein M9953_01725 [Thermomicrobiales bacterium]|nr:hypothetical protein [Thermomicrobiales bacterium]MCO5224032.1 hypothetical protein [Thermomicrobiales bacterium]